MRLENVYSRLARIETNLLLLERSVAEVRRELDRMETGVPDQGWIAVNMEAIHASALAINSQVEVMPC